MFRCYILAVLLILPLLSEGRKFSAQIAELNSECGPIDITEPSGEIKSPGYPRPYPEHISCSWSIHYPLSSLLTVRLTDVDIEEDVQCSSPPCCSENWVSLASTRLCGHNISVAPFSASNKTFLIKFHVSKVIKGGRGFRLSFLVCKDDQFRCSDNLGCIDGDQHCDGIAHCTDMSDEWACEVPKKAHLVIDACSGENMIPCGGGDSGCFNNVTSRCNGITDCPNTAADELNCGVCGPNMLYCKSGGCYPLWGSCDGMAQCTGGWAEGNRGGCGSCPDNHVPCGPQDQCRCFHRTQRCDNQMDCPRGEDELSCVPGCEDKITCASVEGCYSPEERCDGIPHCSDSSDEVGCYTQSFPSKFRCASSGRCVDDIYVCNGQDDCEDGSDESDCIRNSVVTVIVMGSLACGLLAVLGVACGWRYYTSRNHMAALSINSNNYQRHMDQGPLDEGSLYHLYREPPPSYHEAVLQGASAPVYCHPTRFMNMTARGESSAPVAAPRRQRPRSAIRPRSSRIIPKPQPVIKPNEESPAVGGVIPPSVIAGDQLYPESGTSTDRDTPMLELSDNNVCTSTLDNSGRDLSSRSPSGTSCSSLLSCESNNNYHTTS